MKQIELTFIIALILCVICFIVFFYGTGFHPRNKKIVVSIAIIFMAVVSYFFPLPSCIIIALATISYYLFYARTLRNLKVDDDELVEVSQFENNYSESNKDTCGNYVIFSYSDKKPSDFSSYETAYVGSSRNVNKEIHKIINNKTLSRVYDDIQNNKAVYIQVLPCEKENLNANQQKLIDMYKAVPYLKSFSETKGKK